MKKLTCHSFGVDFRYCLKSEENDNAHFRQDCCCSPVVAIWSYVSNKKNCTHKAHLWPVKILKQRVDNNAGMWLNIKKMSFRSGPTTANTQPNSLSLQEGRQMILKLYQTYSFDFGADYLTAINALVILI